MIFYATILPNFEHWLVNDTILKALEPIQKNSRYVESDQMFCAATDEDFDLNLLVNLFIFFNFVTFIN